MKRIILAGVILFSIFSFTSANDIISKVFLINSYTYNDIEGVYSVYSHGSAVYISDGKILTNAHVVLGDDGLPAGYYELCISSDFTKKPTCKTALKLIKYDEDKDLALLEPVSPIDLGSPVVISDKKLDLGDTVQAYGYPANGGSTITMTQGKISGLENGMYKIDANLDNGNSGGGGFDENGNFIGVPSSVNVGLSTLGYMIPISWVREFLDIPVDYDYEVKTSFISYIDWKKDQFAKTSIDNTYFSVGDFGRNGMNLSSAAKTIDGKLYNYLIETPDYNTSLFIQNEEKAGSLKELSQDDLMKYYDQYYVKSIMKKGVSVGNNKFDVWLFIGEKDLAGDIVSKDSLKVVLTDKSKKITFSINSNINYIRRDVIKLIKYVFTTYKSKSIIATPDKIDNKIFSLSLTGNFNYSRVLYGVGDGYNEVFNYFMLGNTDPTNVSSMSSTMLCADDCLADSDMSDFMIEYDVGLQDEGINILESALLKNTKGKYYKYTKFDYGQTIVYGFIFYTKDNLGNVYTIVLYFYIEADSDSESFRSSIRSFINQINIKGSFPFKNLKYQEGPLN